MTPPTCPYCGRPARLSSGREIYEHRNDLGNRRYWQCIPCDAFTGADEKNFAPVGTMANPELRKARAAAYAAFHPIWQSGAMSRNAAYRWLAEALHLPKPLVHINRFDVATCARVVEIVSRRA